MSEWFPRGVSHHVGHRKYTQHLRGVSGRVGRGTKLTAVIEATPCSFDERLVDQSAVRLRDLRPGIRERNLHQTHRAFGQHVGENVDCVGGDQPYVAKPDRVCVERDVGDAGNVDIDPENIAIRKLMSERDRGVAHAEPDVHNQRSDPSECGLMVEWANDRGQEERRSEHLVRDALLRREAAPSRLEAACRSCRGRSTGDREGLGGPRPRRAMVIALPRGWHRTAFDHTQLCHPRTMPKWRFD